MVYQDLYTLIIRIDGTKIELDMEDYSIAIKESIHRLYPTVSFTLSDHSGFIQEALGTSLGLEIEIGFGVPDLVNTAKYSINYDYLDSPQMPGFLGGDVDIFLTHNMAFKQTIVSQAYSDRISFIVKKLTNKYDFAEQDIHDTGNESIWYQTLITDAKFIQERLLPFAYSTNADKTPFYSYITNDNVYHFRNYKSMIDEGVTGVIEYRVISGETSSEDNTTDIKRWKTELKSLYKNFNRQIFSIDHDTGDILEDNDSITDYPKANNLKLPIINVTGNYTGYIDEYLTFEDTGNTESIQGFRIHEQRNSIHIDQFLILQPFNPKLHAGTAIKLNIYSMGNDGKKLSTTYAGLYVIEECEQVWDAQLRRAFTKLIVSRKYLNVPNTQLLKGKLK